MKVRDWLIVKLGGYTKDDMLMARAQSSGRAFWFARYRRPDGSIYAIVSADKNHIDAGHFDVITAYEHDLIRCELGSAP